MNYQQYLTAAGVPGELHAEALACLQEGERRADGLAWAKWKVRLFKAGKIAKLLQWRDERLCTVRPELADWDIAPMLNITAHGDNVPWAMTPDGGRPAPGQWLDTDPASAEYRQAVAANYWCKGAHPRSTESRKAWYRRNAGEYRAWSLGIPVSASDPRQVWRAPGVEVHRVGAAWLMKASRKVLGFLPVQSRVGFEVDNVFRSDGVQAWFPIDGHDLRAPVTCSHLPRANNK